MEKSLYVYSCGIEFSQELAREIAEKNAYSYALFGSRSLLEQYAKDNKNIFLIGAKAKEDAAYAVKLAQLAQKENKIVLVLCSGDALYHSFGASLLREALKAECHNLLYFKPNITAFQTLFHKIALPWDDVSLYSAHKNVFPLREILSVKMPLIYGGTEYPAHIMAQDILEYCPEEAHRECFAAEYLGSAQERIIKSDIQSIAKEEFSPTSILLLLPSRIGINHAPTHILPLGLPEEVYEKENNLITASDARAIILSRLRLPYAYSLVDNILWDLGAGSGSVGLEAAALCPHLKVHAVEQNEERVEIIKNNQDLFQVMNYEVHHSKMLELMPYLPRPSRIFIGGGGKDLFSILYFASLRLLPNGIMLVTAVTLESFHALYAWKGKEEIRRTACLCLDISVEESIAKSYHHFAEQHRLYIFCYEKRI